MDEKIKKLIEKAKIYAGSAGQAAETAGRRAGAAAQNAKLNLQIFDLNAECEVIYKEIGKLVYDIHQGMEAGDDEVEKRLAAIDERQAKIAELREQMNAGRLTVTCPSCGRVCSRSDVFCAACGTPLPIVLEEEPKEEAEPVEGEPVEADPEDLADIIED